MVEQGGILHDWARLLSAVEHAEPDVVVLYLGSRPGQTLSMARRVLSSPPSLRLVALPGTHPPAPGARDGAACALAPSAAPHRGARGHERARARQGGDAGRLLRGPRAAL